MVNEAHAPWRDRSLFDILKQMRHDGCGGLPGRAELLTGIEGASSRIQEWRDGHGKPGGRAEAAAGSTTRTSCSTRSATC